MLGTIRQSQPIERQVELGVVIREDHKTLSANQSMIFIARVTATYLDVFKLPRTDKFDLIGSTTKFPPKQPIVMMPNHEIHLG